MTPQETEAGKGGHYNSSLGRRPWEIIKGLCVEANEGNGQMVSETTLLVISGRVERERQSKPPSREG